MRIQTLRCVAGSNPAGSMLFFLKGTDVFGLKVGELKRGTWGKVNEGYEGKRMGVMEEDDWG